MPTPWPVAMQEVSALVLYFQFGTVRWWSSSDAEGVLAGVFYGGHAIGMPKTRVCGDGLLKLTTF